MACHSLIKLFSILLSLSSLFSYFSFLFSYNTPKILSFNLLFTGFNWVNGCCLFAITKAKNCLNPGFNFSMMTTVSIALFNSMATITVSHWRFVFVIYVARKFLGSIFTSIKNASSFNQPLEAWNVSNVTDMSGTFRTASSFNQPLEAWNVSNVTDMYCTFYNASSLAARPSWYPLILPT